MIESAVWSVDFPDIDDDTFKKGNIIIGEFPHIYDSKYYKEAQFFKIKMSKKEIIMIIVRIEKLQLIVPVL